ncbi:MAG: hypothetical protein RR201_02950, partial [Malacoplasma sp.]
LSLPYLCDIINDIKKIILELVEYDFLDNIIDIKTNLVINNNHSDSLSNGVDEVKIICDKWI